MTALRGRLEGCPPESAGRPHEAGGNAGPRWMAVSPAAARRPGDRTRRTARLVRPYTSDLGLMVYFS